MKKLILLFTLLLPLFAYSQCGPYTAHAPRNINGGTNITIRGDSINMAGANGIGININNVRGLHIIKCKIINNVNNYAIKITNCKNVVIDSCDIENVGFGIYCQKDTSVQVNANRLLNMNGWAGQATMGHGIQFDNVRGGGNAILWNNVWNPSATNPHDQISVYESNGLPGDSIMVMHNRVLLGQTFLTGGNGACGIGMADTYGSYQVCRYDTVSTSGYAGIQPIGGKSPNPPCVGISIDHNVIYGSKTSISLLGLSVQIGTASTGIYVGYNKVKWTDYNGHLSNFYYNGILPAGWSTNISDNTLTSAILPTNLWTACGPNIAKPIISYTTPRTFITGDVVSISPSNSGGPPSVYAINKTPPAGTSFNTLTGVLSGTVTTIQAATTYTITATNSGGSATASLSITINVAPPVISYSSPKTYTSGVTITPLSPTSTGGAVATYAGTLPPGLSLNTSTGQITGTPTTASSSTAYGIRAINSTGSYIFNLVITVNAPPINIPVISYTNKHDTATYGYTSSVLTPTNSGGAIVSWAIAPSLPAGLNFASGIISGIPTVTSASTQYIVSGTNTAGTSRDTIYIYIKKADLSIRAVDITKTQGQPNPPLLASYEGFVLGDTNITTAPTLSTTAVQSSPVGSYTISISGGASSLYNLTLTPGTLSIIKNIFITGYSFGGIVH